MKKIAMTRKELEAFAVRTWDFQKTSLRRMSTLFLAQLLQMKLQNDHRVHLMAREVQCLESNNRFHRFFNKGDGPAGRLQEWIVFKTHNGTKYYLTMASLDEGDGSINRRVHDACDFDFPFLQAAA